MADTPANRLDPGAIEARTFDTGIRGYNQTEVRNYLKGLADSIRREARERSASVQAVAQVATDDAAVSELETEIASLRSEVARLESEQADLSSKLSAAEAARSKAEAEAESLASSGGSGELDEARMTQLLGEETTAVLDSARTAAANITARAENDAKRRMDELEALEQERLAASVAAKEASDAEIERLTTAALEAAEAERTAAAEEAEAERTSAKEEAARLRAEADEAATTVRTEAETAAEAARVAADEVAVAVKTRAEEVAREVRLAAEAEAETAKNDAESLRGDATADAARIRAEAEADASTSQDAAREEARLMLAEAQSLREKVLGDLVEKRRLGRHQLDQAKAARDRLARSLTSVRTQLDESIGELDVAVPEARQAMDSAQVSAPVDSEREAQALATELDTARGAGIPIPGSPQPKADDAAEDEAEVADEPEAQDDGATGTTSSGALAVTDPSPAESDDDSQDPDSQDPDSQAADAEDTAGEDSAEDEPEEQIEVSAPFVARDVALTRNGAGLRRQFKRALADDQSDVLDRLRQKRKKLSADDLPDEKSQVLRYIDAIGPALTAMADEGASLIGGDTAPADEVDALIERTASTLIDSFRSRVVASVGEADDADDVLEPIRAHYREARSSVLPDLTEDALHEAFAIGVYSAIADGQDVAWEADPRHNTSADCHDNTLEVAVKPAAFATGHHRPLGSPGCRCLVIPTDLATELG